MSKGGKWPRGANIRGGEHPRGPVTQGGQSPLGASGPGASLGISQDGCPVLNDGGQNVNSPCPPNFFCNIYPILLAFE